MRESRASEDGTRLAAPQHQHARPPGGERGGRNDRGDRDRLSSGSLAINADQSGTRRARDDVLDEIRKALGGNSTLQWTDFDRSVRQTLHAIYGVGGRPRLQHALQELNNCTHEKSRGSVRNWPAYISKLLRKYFDKLTIERNEERFTEREMASLGVTVPDAKATSFMSPGATASKRASDLFDTDPGELRTPQHRLDGDPFLVPTRVQSSQLLQMEKNGEFICAICLDLCENPVLLNCSHVFCRVCIGDWYAMKHEVTCPACRKPFDPEQIKHKDSKKDKWLKGWLGNIQICCVFAHSKNLPDQDNDPLPPGHRARELDLHCSWVGTVAAYEEHIQKSCSVAARLRELREKADTKSTPQASSKSTDVLETPVKTTKAMRSLDLQEEPRAEHTAQSSSESTKKSIAVKSDTQATTEPDSNWNNVGVFRVKTKWRFSENKAANYDTLEVEAGEQIYLTQVQSQGWAYGTLLKSGKSGWLPFSYCKRHVYTIITAFGEGNNSDGYLKLKPGDSVVVYHRDGRGEWVYGTRLHDAKDGLDAGVIEPIALDPPGWFPMASIQ